MDTNGSDLIELCGAIHLHTTYSDGGIDFPELLTAARSVGLDYIIVTDHMTLAGKDAGFEGKNGNLHILIGYEHEDIRNRNHYLVLGTDQVVKERNRPQEYIDAVKQKGGIGFLAHPTEHRDYFKYLPPYPWTDWNVTGFDGIEIWNQTSDWVENLKNIRSFIRIFFPRRFMSDSPSSLLRRWDELNRFRFVAGIGGVDAHTRKFGFGLIGFTIFPIKVELKGIRTHLFIERSVCSDAAGTRQAVLEALRRGNGFVSNFRRGDARGTRMVIRDKRGMASPPGLPLQPHTSPLRIEVVLPGPAEIRLVRNGAIIAKTQSAQTEFPITRSGVYRIEARRNNRAWIYSNPFPVGTYPLE